MLQIRTRWISNPLIEKISDGALSSHNIWENLTRGKVLRIAMKTPSHIANSKPWLPSKRKPKNRPSSTIKWRFCLDLRSSLVTTSAFEGFSNEKTSGSTPLPAKEMLSDYDISITLSFEFRNNKARLFLQDHLWEGYTFSISWISSNSINMRRIFTETDESSDRKIGIILIQLDRFWITLISYEDFDLCSPSINFEGLKIYSN